MSLGLFVRLTIQRRFQLSNSDQVIKPVLKDLILPTYPWFHFSIDDVHGSLVEASKLTSLFKHPLYEFLSHIHSAYGLCFDLKLFHEQKDWNGYSNLEDVESIRSQLIKAGNFIRFGPHSRNQRIAPHDESSQESQVEIFNTIYKQIDRFAGEDMHCHWVRLHYFSELFELGEYFKSKGVSALLTTDRPVGSYRMGEDTALQLNNYGYANYQGTNFIRTHFRLEDFTNARLTNEVIKQKFEKAIEQYGFIVMLSHEYELMRPEVRLMLVCVLEVLGSMKVNLYNH